jgi:hypothetical protein
MLLQTLIVAAIVAVSAVIATWRLIPARTKLRVLDALKPTANTATGRWLSRLRQGVVNELAHGCSACSSSSAQAKKPSVAGRLGGR